MTTNGTAPYRERRPRRSSTIAVRGVDCCVHEWGSDGAPLVFFLHGWGDTGAAFQFVVDGFDRGWHVIAPDWRGFGDSGRNTAAYWFPDYLADLDVLLERYSPGAAVTLIGHSMGANVASLYAGVFPERVAALVNVEGFGLADSDPANAPANYRRFVEVACRRDGHPGYSGFEVLAARVERRSPRIDAARAAFVARLWGRETADGRVALKADPAHRWPNAVQYRRQEAVACWNRIEAPVLAVSGRESDFAAAAGSWLQQSPAPLADAAHIDIAGAGHMIHFEQPTALAAAIECFLADL